MLKNRTKMSGSPARLWGAEWDGMLDTISSSSADCQVCQKDYSEEEEMGKDLFIKAIESGEFNKGCAIVCLAKGERLSILGRVRELGHSEGTIFMEIGKSARWEGEEVVKAVGIHEVQIPLADFDVQRARGGFIGTSPSMPGFRVFSEMPSNWTSMTKPTKG